MRTPSGIPRCVVLSALVAVVCTARLAAAPSPAPAPARLERGDPSINGAFLKPYENRWTFSIQLPGKDPVEAGVWNDRMEAVTVAGRTVLRRTQVAEYKKGTRVTFVTTFEKASMTPLAFDYSRSDTGETRRLEFGSGAGRDSATFRRSSGTGRTPAQDYVAKLDHRVLDFYDGTYGILLAALPLAEGFDVEIPAFDSDRAIVDWIRVRVTGKETVPAGREKTAEAWVVRVDTEKYGTSTWWLTREAPYVIQATMTTSPDEGSATIVWKMV